MTQTLEDRVRHLIGASGPQLPVQGYEDRIDDFLCDLKPAELLSWISLALTDILDERALAMQATARVTAAPLGSVAQMLGVTGVLLAPVGGRAIVQTRNGSFTAPAHIAQWLATA